MTLLPNSANKFRSAVAAVLILWCAGAGCMLVSYARSTAEMPDEKSSEVSAASPSCHHGGGAMPARSHRPKHLRLPRQSPDQSPQATLTETNPTSESLSCCPLTSGAFVTGSRAQSNDASTSVTLATESGLPTLNKSASTLVAGPLRLPDQEHTYLRCCSFLI